RKVRFVPVLISAPSANSAGVIVGHYVHSQDSGQVVEPVVDHAEIFGVPVGK
ncbi:hypothetical protein ACHAXS_013538, partial [Conticribra weissflogii]